VTYERAGTRWFAGNVLAEATLDVERLAWHAEDRVVVVSSGAHPLRRLGDLLREQRLEGWRAYGYIAFEAAHLLHGTRRLVRHARPLAHLVVPETEIGWSAAGTTIRSTSPAALERIADLLQSPRELPVLTAHHLEPPPAAREAGYQDALAATVRAIAQGRLRKLVISRRVDVPFPVDLLASYLLGWVATMPARSFLLDLRGRRVAGFGQGTLAEAHRDGSVTTRPVTGTARDHPRAWGLKDCYDNALSTRATYEEMLTVCDRDTVAVREPMAAWDRGGLHHLGSQVGGRLAGGRDAWDALEALFPAVSTSGIAKREALETIAAHEPSDRGLYAGAVCMAGADGTLDATLVLQAVFQEEGRTWLQAGTSVVGDLESVLEREETTDKLRAAADCLVEAGDHGPRALPWAVGGSPADAR
jgi:salicylate synthetase